MNYRDVPANELESGKYSKETISTLLSEARREYRQSLRKSVARNVPLLLGSYLTLCACLAGYALGHGESIWFFSKIYVALMWVWLPIGFFIPLQWFRHRPTESTIKEELGWYRELAKKRHTCSIKQDWKTVS